MDNNGFIIENGGLKGYEGPPVKILIIPEGVVWTKAYAFEKVNLQGCEKIVFPKSLKIVGRAFFGYSNKTSVREVEFLGDLDKIIQSAFSHAELDKVTFHGSVGEIEGYAFWENNITELNISKVDRIGCSAFYKCKKLKEVHISEIDSISTEVFRYCEELEVFDVPKTLTNIGDNAFSGCTKLRKNGLIVLNEILFYKAGGVDVPDGIVKIAKHACASGGQDIVFPDTVRVINEQGDNVSFKQPPSEWLQTTEKLSGKGLLEHIDGKWNLDFRDWAAIYLFQSGKNFSDICLKHMSSEFNKYTEEMISFLIEKGKSNHFKKTAEFIMAHAKDIESDTIKRFYELANNKKQAKYADLVKDYIVDDGCTDESNPLAAFKREFNEHLLDKAISLYGGDIEMFSKVRYADSDELAPVFLVKCAVVPYVEMFKAGPKRISGYKSDYLDVKIIEAADKAAALLNIGDIWKLLKKQYEISGSAWLIPYGRYASKEQVNTLILTMKEWENWYTYGTNGRKDIITTRSAIMLSDTREAMMHIDKTGLLDDYAKIRGTDGDSIRDGILAEFGLDESGKKEYDLGTKKVVVSLSQDLELVIYDLAEDKIVKSIPKRGTDPELVEKASADFTEIKKNMKKVAKRKNDVLFEDFLSGKTRLANSWIVSYTKNPLLRRVAELVVWNQGENTFILTENGAVDCNSNPYEINTTTQIGVAHPIEMKREEIESWQKYFTSRGLKQPFSQIWEPVIDKSIIQNDRYKGCLIPYYRFRNQRKHGILLEDYNFHDDIEISFDDCNANVERIDWKSHEINNDDKFEITSFSFKKYTRKVNHIVGYLDKVTIYQRILKDDTSIVTFLDEFTLAQITDFINVAVENKCNNCLALLMDYKNKKYTEYDPMDEFTLD